MIDESKTGLRRRRYKDGLLAAAAAAAEEASELSLAIKLLWLFGLLSGTNKEKVEAMAGGGKTGPVRRFSRSRRRLFAA